MQRDVHTRFAQVAKIAKGASFFTASGGKTIKGYPLDSTNHYRMWANDYNRKEDRPPASLETQRHREDKTQDRECRGIFVREYPSQKSRDGFLEPNHEKEEGIFHLLPLDVFLQGTVAFIFSTCTHVEKLTPHLHFLPFVVPTQ